MNTCTFIVTDEFHAKIEKLVTSAKPNNRFSNAGHYAPEHAMTRNQHNAVRARRVVQGYHRDRVGSVQQNMVELLADLQHLCDVDGLSWADVVSVAQGTYRSDVVWAERRKVGP